MRYLAIALLAVLPLAAGDLPEIKAKDAKKIGVTVIKLTTLQSQVQDLQSKHDKEMIPAQVALNQAVKAYQDELAKMREKYGVDEKCGVTADLKWSCPEEEDKDGQERDQ